MNNPLVNQAAMVLPVFLLSACLGGGGSFDLDSVDTEAPRPAPKYQDVSSETPQAQKDQGGYGFAMRFKRRNWHPKNKEDHKALSEADWEKLGAGKPNEFPQKNEISAMDKGTLNESITPGDGKSRAEGYTDFQYVRSGYIYRNGVNKIDDQNNIALSGPDGYLFYKGSNPSQALPTGKAIYKGTWDYVTDAKEKQKFPQLGSFQAGDRYGALSAEEEDVLRNKSEAKEGQTDFGLTSEFEVDFAAKTMTGKLYRNNRITNNETENRDKQIKRYDIQANLHGNRFNGKATATDKPKENETKQHPFVSDSSSLSGGFFGPQGEELGFRFLSDDQKVAVVGSAKTKDKNANGNTPAASSGAGAATMPSETRLTTVLDAVELKLGDKEVQNLDNFSNAAQLVVDGIMIPLLPKDSESGSNQADKGKKGKNGKNGGTDFTYKTTYTPESDKKDAQAGTQTNGAQTASNTAGDTNGKTKTYEVEVCCSNLNYLKYGMLTRKNSKSAMQAGESSSQADAKTEQVEQSMFLQGERTDEKEIPSEQNIVYRGSWYGYIANDKSTSWSGNASNATSGNRAEFTVNFADKKITGTLTADNRQEATFTIDGNIKDNGFEGTAKTAESGFDLDQSNTTRTPKAYITDAKVQGGFYGPKAEELGGWFAYPGDKQTKNATNASGNSSATVVFGAKRQQPVR
ncbi:transferrin-binding protein-like solute binding protein [Neisseria meningitidis]|uniref:transferrin-binding protein-like solute binding protein n=1 Tax=Neisseria meningitidis TaxID=487 RepID=UPI0021F14716|nr:transferrin-binding protein-like solute binding protein [Neisseria meningitidis]MCV6653209.1 transferrin-binding protein-like solute binding protein [Neisseria meningitidis]MCV6655198.1 transferrin-binding protein-like solute binding protein [Neisseria meningitidis]MCV6661831.1 transferrin-binding protein-like solute binding protein [Neisseria meningitidis]MCV6673878.1 transferrin-binding protein-like solute binding protein [Neisseria meningitidis]MCV6675943.1 transferrin-binding protein-li